MYTLGTYILTFLGGWDIYLKALIVMMFIDYVLGLLLAGVFKNSKNTLNGGLNSYVGWVGLVKKFAHLLLIILAVQLDILLGTIFVRTGTIAVFIVNESISIIENSGLIGIPIPKALEKAIDILNDRSK